MKYNININQLALAGSGLDLKDCAILEYIKSWVLFSQTSSKAKTVVVKDGEKERLYVWINFATMIKDMPLLGIKGKSGISQRIDGLERKGYIRKYSGPDGNIYIRLAEKTKTTEFDIVHGHERMVQAGERDPFTAVNDNILLINNNKNNILSANAEGDFTPKELNDYLNKCLEDRKPHIRVIVNFLSWKGVGIKDAPVIIRNKQQFYAIVSRYSKVATRLLKSYDEKEIERVISLLCSHANFKWELETVEKYIHYSDQEIIKQLQGRKYSYAK